MGQAAGVAVAIAVRRNQDAAKVGIFGLQAELLRQRCVLYFYKDIPPDHAAFEAIQRLSLRGAFRGDQQYHFKPDEPVTRGEAASALVAALELPWSIGASHFRDCAPAHPAFKAVETLYDHGSMAGADAFMPDADGRFRPDESLGAEIASWLRVFSLPAQPPSTGPITRQALAQLLWNALKGRSPK
jgi:hypothetical protein